MSKRITFSIIATIATVAACAGTLSLRQGVDSIVASSPQAKAEIAAMEAAKINVSTSLNLANPEIEAESMWGTPGNKTVVGISQAFDWPGVYPARSRVAQYETNLAACERMRSLANLRWEVEDLLINLQAQQQKLDKLNEIDANYAALTKAFQSSYENGEGTILDVKKIRIQQLGLFTQISQVQLEYDQLLSQLQAINPTVDLKSLVAALDSKLLTLPQRDSLSPKLHPDYMVEQATSMLSQERIRLTRQENMPSLSVGYVFNREFGDNFNGFRASFTLPAWGNRNKVAAAEAQYQADQSQIDVTLNRISHEIDNDFHSAEILRQRCREYDSLLNDNDNLRLLRLALEGGEMTLMEYLQEIDFYLQADLDHITTHRDYQLIAARLYRLL